ncbi:MAG: hypothetical protein HPY75_03480 [Actinobacteria bacterium]|nr:hypothetical protein [Actinomycetota bacterium]
MRSHPGDRGTVFCAVDVETSGLFMGSRLVEIGAVRFSAQGALDEFHTLVDPGEPIRKDATDIHGITDAMVKGCPHPDEVMEEFLDYLEGAVLLAHNARFDVSVIGSELARAGLDPPSNHVVDTVLLARSAFPGLPDYRLGTVARCLGIVQDQQHRGLPDALVAMHIFLRSLDGSPVPRRVEDIPGYLGHFSDISPRLELELRGTARDLMVLANRKAVVEMIYDGGSSPGMPRMVTPLQVWGGEDYGYFRAYCHRSGTVKTYRIDRVLELRLP